MNPTAAAFLGLLLALLIFVTGYRLGRHNRASERQGWSEINALARELKDGMRPRPTRDEHATIDD